MTKKIRKRIPLTKKEKIQSHLYEISIFHDMPKTLHEKLEHNQKVWLSEQSKKYQLEYKNFNT